MFTNFLSDLSLVTSVPPFSSKLPIVTSLPSLFLPPLLVLVLVPVPVPVLLLHSEWVAREIASVKIIMTQIILRLLYVLVVVLVVVVVVVVIVWAGGMKSWSLFFASSHTINKSTNDTVSNALPPIIRRFYTWLPRTFLLLPPLLNCMWRHIIRQNLSAALTAGALSLLRPYHRYWVMVFKPQDDTCGGNSSHVN